MKKERQIRRAREEIVRCNVEVHRLHTWIIDENTLLDSRVRALQIERDPIAGALASYSVRRQRLNSRLLATISQIYALDGYTGRRVSGQRLGDSPATQPTAAPEPTELAAEFKELAFEEQDDTPDEGDMAEADRVLEFATSLM